MSPDVCKSKSQFLIDAAEYYIDHFGKEAFVTVSRDEQEYVTRTELENLKRQMIDAAVSAAKDEIIRISLGAKDEAETASYNELFSFTRQKKIDHATNITSEIGAYAYQIFKASYDWRKPIRSVGVRGADLVTDNYWEQIDLFSSVEFREKQMKVDAAVDDIRRRFGFYSIQRGLMYRDKLLSAVNAREDHVVHPHG